ncbi:hypothetical protein AIT23_19890 [Salmonella bongori serovar 40:z35:-]|uniref:Uncharacterized protein n=1 Tax=Salmonella bongori TaxID=54736 RepID=A0A698W910_SALBN|nr:hypothetical protein [Salmonella bongori]EGE4655984.1 hypothetical protein [Salmonella bongori serovar 40:z35:- str. 95-0123]QVP37226.1 hypothetical protein AIT23_19890 [Salmonella bongori serovar 40:z35:-]
MKVIRHGYFILPLGYRTGSAVTEGLKDIRCVVAYGRHAGMAVLLIGCQLHGFTLEGVSNLENNFTGLWLPGKNGGATRRLKTSEPRFMA